jgi:hypothetical protein
MTKARENYDAKIAEIKDWTFYLSSLADCGSPDSTESAGFEFLASVRDNVLDRLDPDTWDDRADFERVTQDLASEIAGEAPDYRTYTKWRQFVDLCAFQEDLDDWGGASGDWDKDSDSALVMIAERLVGALLGEIAEAIGEDDDASDDEDG